jgi:peptide/nickel transport system substrate-binding protein
VTAACSSGGGVAATPSGPTDKSLSVGLSTFSEDVLDPVVLNGSTVRALLNPVFSSLVGVGSDGNLVAGALQDWKPNADASSWTFKVHPGIKFQDGWGDATAADVAFTLQRYATAAAPVSSFYAASINAVVKSVTVVDPMTVTINLVKADALFPSFLSGYNTVPPIVLLPKKYIEQKGVAAFREHPIGSGPYVFTSHAAGSNVVLTRNPGYWGKAPSYKTLTFRLLPDESSRINSIRSGELDVAEVSPDGSTDAKAAGANIVKIDGASQVVVQFGQALQSTGPVANLKVRQALSLAINRKELIKALIPGGVLPNVPGMLPTSVGFDFAGWQDKADKAYAYDPTEAKKLLKEAGYPDGFTITLLAYNIAGASLPSVAQVVADAWKKIGVKVSYRPISFAAFGPLRDKEPNAPDLLGQAFTHRYPISANPATFFQYMYDSKRLFRELNNGPYTSADSKVQDILNKIDAVTDAKQRSALFDQLTELTYKQYLVVPVAQVPALFAVAKNVSWKPGLNPYVGSTIYDAVPK